MTGEINIKEFIVLDDFELERDVTLLKSPKKLSVLNTFRRSSVHRERRKHRRFLLDLPFEYRLIDTPSAFGGIVVNGGEGGFLIRSFREMTVGSKLNVTVLFPLRFELATFETLARIVRRENRKRGQPGVQYGVKIDRIRDADRLKLRYVLGLSPMIHG